TVATLREPITVGRLPAPDKGRAQALFGFYAGRQPRWRDLPASSLVRGEQRRVNHPITASASIGRTAVARPDCPTCTPTAGPARRGSTPAGDRCGPAGGSTRTSCPPLRERGSA